MITGDATADAALIGAGGKVVLVLIAWAREAWRSSRRIGALGRGGGEPYPASRDRSRGTRGHPLPMAA